MELEVIDGLNVCWISQMGKKENAVLGNRKISAECYSRSKREHFYLLQQCFELHLFVCQYRQGPTDLFNTAAVTKLPQYLYFSCLIYGILMGLLYQNTVYSLSIQVLSVLCNFCSNFPFCHWCIFSSGNCNRVLVQPGLLCVNQLLTGLCCRLLKCWCRQFVLAFSLFQELKQLYEFLAIPATDMPS